MEPFWVSDRKIYDTMFTTITTAVNVLNDDIKNRVLELAGREGNAIAKLNLELSLKNCVDYNLDGGHFLCPDTGAPTFYVRLGDNVRLENGYSRLYVLSQKAVADATAQFRLRPNMVHPFTRANTGTNTGYGSPALEILFDPDIDFFEVTAVPVSGGSESSGTFYRMLSPLDGKKGVLKFILDCFQNSTYGGKTCPPNIVGIGIGGAADDCMKLAKQAAVLRPVGSRHPEPDIAKLELELVEVLNASGVGAMGMGGSSGVLDVHIEYAAAHISGLPVAYNAQCWIGRRKVGRIHPDGSTTYHDYSDWRRR